MLHTTDKKQVAAETDGEEKKGSKTGHLKAMAAGADGTVFVAFKHGKIERYLPHGKLLFSKVGALLFQVVACKFEGRAFCSCRMCHTRLKAERSALPGCVIQS